MGDEEHQNTIEVWIVMNEDGDYEVGKDVDDAAEQFDDNLTGSLRRIVKINVNMTPPQVREANVAVPDDADTVRATTRRS